MGSSITVRSPELLTNDWEAKAREKAIAEGWGVLERRAGMVSSNSVTIVEVREERDAADQLASELNASKSFTEYEVSGDPETSVYSSCWFEVAPVKLSECEVEVKVLLTYEQTDI